MRWPVLARRRALWVPTLWGWALAFIFLAAACVLVGQKIHSFLAPDQPVGARLLVVEGWMAPEQLDQAIARFRDGSYGSLITTGGPVSADLARNTPTSYANLARAYLVQHGIPSSAVIAVPAPASAQERTYLSAVMVRLWLAQSGNTIEALDVFSAGVHSRRTWTLYRMAFGPKVGVGILAARPIDYDPDAWWKTSTGAKSVISEAISWIWTKLFFQPPAQGSHEEKWGLAQQPVQNAK